MALQSISLGVVILQSSLSVILILTLLLINVAMKYYNHQYAKINSRDYLQKFFKFCVNICNSIKVSCVSIIIYNGSNSRKTNRRF